MEFEHNNLENSDMLSEMSEPSKGKDTPKATTKNDSIIPSVAVEESSASKSNLFLRRRHSQLASKNEDELRVVIERDNMIVGFVDAVDSDATDDSESDDDDKPRRKWLKRARSQSPKLWNRVSTSFFHCLECPYPSSVGTY